MSRQALTGRLAKRTALDGRLSKRLALTGRLDSFYRLPSDIYTYLLSWWSLDEAAGQIRADSHGDNDAAEVLATVGQTNGVVNQAASFATTAYLSVPTNPTLQGWASDSVSWSGCAWFYPNALAYNSLMSLYSGSSTARSWAAWMQSDGRFSPFIYHGTFGSYLAFAAGTAQIGAWNCAAWRYDHTTRTLSASLNGSAFGDGDSVTIVNDMNLSNYPLNLGSLGSGTFSRLNGRMDEAALWRDYALSDDDVTWFYNGGAGRSYAEFVTQYGGGT